MREGTKAGRTERGVTSIEGKMVNSRVPDIAMYLCTAFHDSGVDSLRARFGTGSLGRNLHSCNQTCLDSDDSQ